MPLKWPYATDFLFKCLYLGRIFKSTKIKRQSTQQDIFKIIIICFFLLAYTTDIPTQTLREKIKNKTEQWAWLVILLIFMRSLAEDFRLEEDQNN